MRIMNYLAGLCLFCNATLIPADEKWPYDRLFKSADLVVIASAKGTVDTDDKYTITDPKMALSGQDTHFEINSILKGQNKVDRIRVLHYALPAGKVIANGPKLVSFRKEGRFLVGEGIRGALSRPEYMLFLRELSDGRYEPVSGQEEAACSVREIYGFEDMFRVADKKDE